VLACLNLGMAALGRSMDERVFEEGETYRRVRPRAELRPFNRKVSSWGSSGNGGLTAKPSNPPDFGNRAVPVLGRDLNTVVRFLEKKPDLQILRHWHAVSPYAVGTPKGRGRTLCGPALVCRLANQFT
jgi:hypothetical protein